MAPPRSSCSARVGGNVRRKVPMSLKFEMVEEDTMGRRDAMAAVAGVASLMLFQPAEAAEAKVTKKVFFEYKIAGRTKVSVLVGCWETLPPDMICKAMENEKWEKV
eukprot:748856-Hanusia_phi.AAC.2